MAVLEDAKVWEGTWEEVAAHAEEFKGRRVQLMVFNGASSKNGTTSDEKPLSLAEDLADYIGIIDGPETDISSRAKELWGEYVEEKHRRIKEQRREP